MIINNKEIIKPTMKNKEVNTMIPEVKMNSNECTKINPDGEMIVFKSWEPAGSPNGNKLKRDITNLMDSIVRVDGRHTLAELGYLHMNLVSYSNGQVRVKVYFAPELATMTLRNGVNTNGKIVPHEGLNVFKNYLFVGELKDAITYETMSVPQYEIKRDARDQLAIYIKDNKKKVNEDAEVVVLNCNLLLLMASMEGINLWDENFKVDIETVGKSKKKENDMAIMINVGAYQEFPVRINMQYTAKDNSVDEYNPDDAIPYLINRMKKMSEAKDTKKKLADKATDRAKETVKELKKNNDVWMKYR